METRFFLCKICGNVVVKFEDSGAPLSCCGQQMEELIPENKEMFAEKHIPVVEKVDDSIFRVKIGSIPHPMTPDHHISFIYLETRYGGQLHYLKPTDKPEAVFCGCKDEPIAVYAYCTIHGLWKMDLDDNYGSKCCTRSNGLACR